MVHIGCGADVIRQRRRNEQLRKEAEAQGIYVGIKDFKPAKNKKYPHFTHARDKDVFNGRKCSHMKVVHKPADKGSTFSRGSSVDSQTSESSATSSRSTGYAVGLCRSPLPVTSEIRRHSTSKLTENLFSNRSNLIPKLTKSINPFLNRSNSPTTKLTENQFSNRPNSDSKSLLQIGAINSLSDQSRSSITPSPSGSSRNSSIVLTDHQVDPTVKPDHLSNPSVKPKQIFNQVQHNSNEKARLSPTSQTLPKPKKRLAQIGRQNAFEISDSDTDSNAAEQYSMTDSAQNCKHSTCSSNKHLWHHNNFKCSNVREPIEEKDRFETTQKRDNTDSKLTMLSAEQLSHGNAIRKTSSSKLTNQSKSLDVDNLEPKEHSSVQKQNLGAISKNTSAGNLRPCPKNIPTDQNDSPNCQTKPAYRIQLKYNCKLLHKDQKDLTIRQLEPTTSFKNDHCQSQNCDFSSQESMIWLEHDLKLVSHKLLSVNRHKPLNGIFNHPDNCEQSSNQHGSSNSSCSCYEMLSQLSLHDCDNVNNGSHGEPQFIYSSFNSKPSIKSSFQNLAFDQNSIVTAGNKENTFDKLTNSRKLKVDKKSSSMSVQADVHFAPLNSDSSFLETKIKTKALSILDSKTTITKSPEINSSKTRILERDFSITKAFDYNPLTILENDFAQFQDFGLPTHIASMEDII